MGKFHQFELSVRQTSVFSFWADNLSKYQWIFAKLGMCIDIMKIWLGIANGKFSSIFGSVICPLHGRIFVFG